LLDPSPDDTQSSPTDRPQRGQRIIEAVKRLLFRESEVRPLLLVLEDLHSIDQETMALIDGLVDGLPGARIMVLVSFRPEFHHSWTSKSYFAQIRVDPLLHDIASELLDALIGLDEALGQIKEFLIEKTGGTPLFLEESVRSLVETGVLNGKHADYHSTTSIVELKIPRRSKPAELACRQAISRQAPAEPQPSLAMKCLSASCRRWQTCARIGCARR
jgi:predicted ATPase